MRQNDSYERGDGVVMFLDGHHIAAFCHFLMGADTFEDDRSAFFVGYMYEFGLGVKQNYELAYEYFISCQDDDEGEAAYNLAIFHYFGLGADKDPRRALSYMEKSAEMGCIEAQMYLAGVYLSGYLNPPSIFAVTLLPYHKAIDRPAVPLLMGDVREMARDPAYFVPVSETDATRMLSLAAAQDDAYAGRLLGDAKFLLAQAFLEGYAMESRGEGGTERDHEAFERLLLDAAVNDGSREAAAYIAAHRDEFQTPALCAYVRRLALEEKKD